MGERGKVWIGFYMCLYCWWRQVVVGSRVGTDSIVLVLPRGLGDNGKVQENGAFGFVGAFSLQLSAPLATCQRLVSGG